MKTQNPIEAKLVELRANDITGLMTHVVLGYPTTIESERLIRLMASSGVDFIELQIPFSDPLADGSTIMRACELSLEQGFRVNQAFEIAKRLSKDTRVPLIFMAYFNTVYKYGVENFCRRAKEVGISGLIVPDMPIEEESSEHFAKYCKIYGLCNIRVISPVSTHKRLLENSKVTSGFIYCTARQGVTGAQKKIDSEVFKFLGKLRQYFTVPIAVGFGVSSSEHVLLLSKYCDVVVVGSALINVIDDSKMDDLYKNVKQFIKSLQTGGDGYE